MGQRARAGAGLAGAGRGRSAASTGLVELVAEGYTLGGP